MTHDDIIRLIDKEIDIIYRPPYYTESNDYRKFFKDEGGKVLFKGGSFSACGGLRIGPSLLAAT